MAEKDASKNIGQERRTHHFDLSEEGSRRPEGDPATTAARQSESDDINEETDRGPVDAAGDFFGENKLSTSLDDE